ncbi:bifunctional tRNA (5-methylaminomethyl-2-thiouridine)(34)-methyltransferase MnmD/FAD-dependent 5-carboxymethylaminomethyl-2-thiouridine(34) oxidoreductase MnmC [Psychromonas algicola]|uniref:bifunctional tRNA (5-methylaminomethyl-2-thiouridine)(34)-methyltransferase MnmD/FAD-dependent 5-carboxymethylaminomethyl-2-thiouridine(34) oxidoreductase MnmC n=1 Tax=Psychromonas algicola TaxID=2555642 RepID=UPI001FBBC55D|nr:bifunctional tRNA (5-methylaminomethyl-2-thiouridine)(34)-methyltransferase MnmD/FAD-dependent 5-carboxymethylaminomethyl-2-thiouridine(34) oxidoreductase MnmC [Psychromonas sp. RZ5]
MIAYNGEYNLSDAKNNIIMHAQLHWSDQSEPFSTQFNDIYFNSNQGVKESQYVFFDGNDLQKRWADFSQQRFCIIETGFGSGLNFFNTCKNFLQFKQTSPEARLQKLHFISFEKYPLTHFDLQKTLASFPQFSSLTKQLLIQYPLPVVGCHRLMFDDGNIILDLWFGDINEQINNLTDMNIDQIADAWYLDGFNPSSNPDMWQSSLFNKLVEYSKPEATLATFTAAGFVRRNLIEAGFEIRKRKGYGKKREMLTGSLSKQVIEKKQINTAKKSSEEVKDIAIIGGGIASLCTALSLAKRGKKISIYCKDEKLGAGASGNLQGALYPLLNQQHDALGQLFTNAYLFALHYYQNIHQQHPFAHQFNGLIQLAYDQSSEKKLKKIFKANLPMKLVDWIDSEKTNELAGVDINQSALYYPSGGWLSPRELIQSLQNCLTEYNNVQIYCHQQIDSIAYQQNAWHLKTETESFTHQTVIIAAGFDTLKLQQCRALPLSAARGQVSHIKSTPQLAQLKRTLCHEGYITPELHAEHCMGATFKRHDKTINYRESEQLDNHQKLQKCIPNKQWVNSIKTDNQAHIAIRCTTRDHFPYLGKLTDYDLLKNEYEAGHENITNNLLPNIYLITGLGSRGLCSAPLLGEIVASEINQESLPIDKNIYNKMKIPRQWLSYINKNKPLKD